MTIFDKIKLLIAMNKLRKALKMSNDLKTTIAGVGAALTALATQFNLPVSNKLLGVISTILVTIWAIYTNKPEKPKVG